MRTRAVEGDEPDLGVPVLRPRHVDAAAVRGPDRIADALIQLRRQHALAGAVAIHQVELGDLVSLLPVVESGVGDELAIGRDRGVAVGTEPVGELPHGAVRERHLEEVGLERVPFPVGPAAGC